jgi:hypothetical protein
MRYTSARILYVVVLAITLFGLSCEGQMTRRKRVLPVLVIEDLNPYTHNEDVRSRERQLGLDGFHETKLNRRAQTSISDVDFMSFDFCMSMCMSMEFCMSMGPAPTPSAPLPTTGPSPTTPPILNPTNLPAPVPAPEPTPPSPQDNCELKSREEAMVDVLSAVTDTSILTNPSTPQGTAFRWLVDSDPAKIDPCTYTTATQRYALTTFYYSTNGDDWTDSTGWLTETNECTWFGISCGSNLVTQINIGTHTHGYVEGVS